MSEFHPSAGAEQQRLSLRDRVANFMGQLGLAHTQPVETALEPDDGSALRELLEKYQTTEADKPQLEPTSEEAQNLVAALQRAPQLEAPLFLQDSRLQDNGRKLLSIEARFNTPVDLPVHNFISAPGLKDWQGRDGVKTTPQGTTSSQAVIKKYSKKSTTPPPIGMVIAYVQPNGYVLYSAVQDGAHRIAAAHARKPKSGEGVRTIPVGDTILLKQLPTNIVKPN